LLGLTQLLFLLEQRFGATMRLIGIATFDPVAFTANDFNGIRERLKRTVSGFLSSKYRQSGPSDFLGRSQQGHGRAQFSIRQLN
jgi:hypothetical protein